VLFLCRFSFAAAMTHQEGTQRPPEGQPMVTRRKRDDVLEARIQHALAPYVGRLTPDALAEARRLLAVTLTTHPVLAPLVEQLHASAAPGASGVVTTEDDAAADDRPAADGRGGVKG
jgi:hypothetical protein